MRKKIGILLVCLMLVITSIIIVSAKRPNLPTPANYLELPPIATPETPTEGWRIYCDESDGNLKAIDNYSMITVLAEQFIPPTPPPTEGYRVGIYGKAQGVSSNFIAKTYNGCILNVKDGNGVQLFTVNKSADSWNVTKLIGNMGVNYDYPTGIYYSGDSNTGAEYRGISYDYVDSLNYSVEMLINFVSGWGNLGIMFNYIDEDNWMIAHLIWERTGNGGIRWGILTDGVWDIDYIVRDLSPTDYVLKVNVNNYDGVFEIYVDDVLEHTETM